MKLSLLEVVGMVYRVVVILLAWLGVLIVGRPLLGYSAVLHLTALYFIAIQAICFWYSDRLSLKGIVQYGDVQRIKMVFRDVNLILILLVATDIRIPERFLVALGVVCNLVVILTNRCRMPVLLRADDVIPEVSDHTYELCHEDTRLRSLCDWIKDPFTSSSEPRYMSIGDIIMYLGYVTTAVHVTFFL